MITANQAKPLKRFLIRNRDRLSSGGSNSLMNWVSGILIAGRMPDNPVKIFKKTLTGPKNHRSAGFGRLDVLRRLRFVVGKDDLEFCSFEGATEHIYLTSQFLYGIFYDVQPQT